RNLPEAEAAREQRSRQRVASLARVKTRGLAQRNRKPDVFGAVARLHLGDVGKHERLGVGPAPAGDADAHQCFAFALAFAFLDERSVGKAKIARRLDVMLGERIATDVFVKLRHAKMDCALRERWLRRRWWRCRFCAGWRRR